MCTGGDPLGCGKCPSCSSIEENGLEAHPDFLEVDAASNPGVEHARDLLDRANQPPSQLSRRRFTVIDEAHRMSREAWDVFLKPLEDKDTTSILVFVTNEGDKIPRTITSRCLSIQFRQVNIDVVKGLLAKIATENGIDYELEALHIIARRTKGIVRDAIGALNMCASMGKISVAAVKASLDNSLEDLCLECYSYLIQGKQVEAVKKIDEAGLAYPTNKVLEMMFSVYARTPWAEPGTIYASIAARLPNAHEVDDIFIRWSSAGYLPSDALTLLVYELLNTVDVPTSRTPAAKGGIRYSTPSKHGILTPKEFEDFMNETV
jgi:DNA polymerase III subunit gamma/tau